MGMRISSSGMSQASGAAGWQQQRQALQQLTQSLKSGNLQSAQSAFSTLTGNGSKTIDPNSPLGKLGQALASGDLAAAQQDMATLRPGGRHHHGASAPQTVQASPPPSLSDSIGTVVNTVA